VPRLVPLRHVWCDAPAGCSTGRREQRSQGVERLPGGDQRRRGLGDDRHAHLGQQREDSRRIVDGLDGSGTVIVVESGARAAGTLRIHDFDALTVQVEYGRLFQIDDFARAWPLSQVAVGTRLAVQSEQRVKGTIDALIGETYRYGLEHGIRFGLAACAPSLHGLFEYYGFREYLPPAILPNGDAVLRMLLVLEDAAHLRECDSPLQHLVRDPSAAEAPLAWMRRTFKLAH
jgi:hypothetical protein